MEIYRHSIIKRNLKEMGETKLKLISYELINDKFELKFNMGKHDYCLSLSNKELSEIVEECKKLRGTK